MTTSDQFRGDRLLQLLAEPGAFARIDGAAAYVFAARRGVTVCVGQQPAAVLAALAGAGAVTAERRGRTVVHTLNEAGRSRLARHQAPADVGFRQQHRVEEQVQADPARAIEAHFLNTQESPLLWLRRHKVNGQPLVGDAEFAAGERLRADMTLARTMPSLSQDWQRPSRSGVAIGLLPSETRMAACQRVQRALKAVGPELSGVLVDVCGFLKGLDRVERERGWPARSAKLVLIMGLSALARHYGIASSATGPSARRMAYSWDDGAAMSAFMLPTTEGPQPRP